MPQLGVMGLGEVTAVCRVATACLTMLPPRNYHSVHYLGPTVSLLVIDMRTNRSRTACVREVSGWMLGSAVCKAPRLRTFPCAAWAVHRTFVTPATPVPDFHTPSRGITRYSRARRLPCRAWWSIWSSPRASHWCGPM